MADSKKPMSYAAASSKFVGGTKNSQKNPAQREKVVFGDTTPVSTAPTKVAWQANINNNKKSNASEADRTLKKDVVFGNANTDLARTASAPPRVQPEKASSLPKNSPLMNSGNYNISPVPGYGKSPNVENGVPVQFIQGNGPYGPGYYPPYQYGPPASPYQNPAVPNDGKSKKTGTQSTPHAFIPYAPYQYMNPEYVPPTGFYTPPYFPSPKTTGNNEPAVLITPARKSAKIIIRDPTTNEEVKLPENLKATKSPAVKPATPSEASTTKKGIVLRNPDTGEIVTPAPNGKRADAESETKSAPDEISKLLNTPTKSKIVEAAKVDTLIVDNSSKPTPRTQTKKVATTSVAKPISAPSNNETKPVCADKPPSISAKAVVQPAKSIEEKSKDKVDSSHTDSPPKEIAESPLVEDTQAEEDVPASTEILSSKHNSITSEDAVDLVIRKDARALEPAEFSKVNYPRGMTPPKFKDQLLQYSEEIFVAIRNLVISKPDGIPSFIDIYGENESKNSGSRGVNMSRQNSSHSGRKVSRQKSSYGDRVPMTRQGSSRGNLPNRRNKYNPPPPPVLVKSENAWDAKKLDLSEDDKVLKATKGILNKLALDNFEKLSNKIVESDIRNEYILKELMRQICAKAVDESKFCAMYAKLCAFLIHKLPEKHPWICQDNNIATNLFRKFLLQRCQEEFEKDSSWAADDALAQEKRRAMLKNLDTLTEDEKVKFAEEDFKRKQIKKHSLGNIRFVGELYLQKMITEKIMHGCVQQLLKTNEPEEDDVESLCSLLTSIGKELDKTIHHQELVHLYFKKIYDLSNNKSLQSRIRFMLMDLIDLRKNRWVNKNAVAAKSLKEVQKEIDLEEKKRLGMQRIGSSSGRNNLVPQKTSSFRGKSNPSSNRKGDVRADKKSPKNEEGEWNVPSKVALDAISVRSSWGSQNKQSKNGSDSSPVNPVNRYSALDADQDHHISSSAETADDEPEIPAEPTVSEAEILKSAIKHFRDSLLVEDLVKETIVLDENPIIIKFVKELIQFILDKNASSDVSTAIKAVLRKLFFRGEEDLDVVPFRTQLFIDACKEFLIEFEDDQYDFPTAFSNMAVLLLDALESNVNFTFEDIVDISEPLAHYSGKKPMRPKFLADLLKTVGGPEEIIDFIVRYEVDVKKFFPKESDDAAYSKWIKFSNFLAPIATISSIVNYVFESAGLETGMDTSYRWFDSSIDSELIASTDFGRILGIAVVRQCAIDNIFEKNDESCNPIQKTRELYMKIQENITMLKPCLGAIENQLDLLHGTESYLVGKKNMAVFLEDFFRIFYTLGTVAGETFITFEGSCKNETKKILAGWFKYIESEN